MNKRLGASGITKIDTLCHQPLRLKKQVFLVEVSFMNVSLTPELEELVAAKVKSGFYNSASEVVREALRLLKEQDEIKKMRFEELRQDLQKGLDQLERGEYKTFNSAGELLDHIKAEGRKRLASKAKQKRNGK